MYRSGEILVGDTDRDNIHPPGGARRPASRRANRLTRRLGQTMAAPARTAVLVWSTRAFMRSSSPVGVRVGLLANRPSARL